MGDPAVSERVASSAGIQSLHLLLLEEDDDDVRLIQQALDPTSLVTRAATREQFIEALHRGGFDVALVDNGVPALDALAALGMLRATCPEVPVVVVTRPLRAGLAVEFLKVGARDHVLKDDLGRLAAAVERAVTIEAGIRSRKASERATFSSEERYRRLFESTKDGILMLDAVSGLITDANPYICALLGSTREDLLDKQLWEIGIVSDIVASMEMFEELRLTGYVRYSDLPLHTDTATVREVEFISNVYAEGDKTVIQCNIRDISERVHLERARAESDRRLRTMLDNVGLVAVQLDLDGQITYVNDFFLDLVGYQRDEVIGTDWIELFVPAEARDDILATMAAIVAEDGDARHHENEILTRAGERRSIRWSNTVLRDEAGIAVGSASIGEDRTEHHRATRELYSSQQVLAGIVDSLPLRVFWKDTEFVYLGCNTAFANDAGFDDPSEVIGKTDDEMGWAEQANLYRSDDRDVMEAGRPKLLIEEPQTTPDGETITLLTSKVPLRDADGEIVGVLGTYMDVTEKVRQQQTIERSLDATVAALANTVELRDPYTAGHQRRVADLAVSIADALALPPDRVRGLAMAATIHDIGKISIPAEILAKPGRLSAAEFELVKGHAEAGYQMVKDIEFPWPVADMVHQHHERLDGSGYPQGLTDEEILPEAKIMAVADTVEAISSHRPYRPALGPDAALDIILAERGTTLDADAVDACVKLFRDDDYAFPDR